MDSIKNSGAFIQKLQKYSQHINEPYIQFLKRTGLARNFIRAEGIFIYDSDGNRFIDCVAGYGNCNIGHNHPKVIEAVTKELQSPRPFNLPFISDVHTMLSEKLAEITPGNLECSLIVNSGSEAVESALKLARLSTKKNGIIAAHGAWHGFTLGALSISEPSMCTSFSPMLPDITHVPYNSIEAIEKSITKNTGAIIIEPIQAESGAVTPDNGYLQNLSKICTEQQIILIFDEIKTGICKTGHMFACEKDNAVPDIILTGKSLGGGVMPIGAMTARKKIWGKLGYSFPMSSSSGGGNAPACAAALATLEVVEEERLSENAYRYGNMLEKELFNLTQQYPSVLKGISGRGLLLSLHTNDWKTSSLIVSGCIKRNVLIMPAFCDRTKILIEPPLCIRENEIGEIIDVIHSSVREIYHE